MTEEQKESAKKLNEFILQLIGNTDIPDEEKAHCVKMRPGYLSDVVVKSINRDGTKDVDNALIYAIVGFVGGYAARHMYELHKNQTKNN